MAEEGYGLQVSLKIGDNMFNARGADADELITILQGLMDNAEENDLAEWIVKGFGIGEELKATSTRTSSRGGSRSRSSGSRGSSDGEPTDKQIAFAKRLKIRGYAKMSKSELSTAIDEALADQDADDDED